MDIIHTERLTLRPFHDNDLDALLQELDSDEEVWQADPGYRRSVEERKEWLKVAVGEHGTGMGADGLFSRAVTPRDGGRLLGVAGLVPALLPRYLWDPTLVGSVIEPELYYSLGRNHWGHGYMSEACSALLYLAQHHLALDRVIARVQPTNERSIRLLQRLGMHRLEETISNRAGTATLNVWEKRFSDFSDQAKSQEATTRCAHGE